MNHLAIPDIIMGGAVFFAGSIHVVQWLRRLEGPLERAMAEACIAAALVLFSTAGLYGASDPRMALWWARAQHLVIAVTAFALLVFSAQYAGVRLRLHPLVPWVYGGSIAVLFMITGQAPALFEGTVLDRVVSLPGLDSGVVSDYRPGIVTVIHFTVIIAMLVGAMILVRRHRGPAGRRRDRVLVVALGLLATLIILDRIAVVGRWPVPYLASYGFFGIVVLMTHVLVPGSQSMVTVRTALTESEERFRGIVELAPYPIAIIDAGQRFEYFNPRFIEIFGYTLADLPDVSAWFRAAYPEGPLRDKALKSWTPALKHPGSKTVGRREFTVRCKNGSTRDIIFRLYIMQDGKSFVIFDDITDRKRAMTELIESKENYRLIYENASEAIYSLDMDMRIRNISPSIERILGYRPAELVGSRVADLPVIAPESRQAIGRDVASVFAGATIRAAEYRLINKRGVPLYVEMSMAPLMREGRMAGLVSIVRDISERKKMEMELLKASKIESLGIFAGGIAHDFNNLLTAVVGNISLAKALITGSREIEDILNEAEKASLRAKDLTHQLLTFSRGGLPIRKTAMIGNLLRETAAFVLRGSGLGSDFSIPPDLWHADVDEGQISQVIHNVVLNARQSMSTGVITIAAENVVVDHASVPGLVPGRYCRISITDQGPGIPHDVLPYIFDPYFTTKSEGSGLGLSVSYSIIRNHGGIIQVDTQAGRGTTFSIYVPASRDTARHEHDRPASARPPGGRVLVMDDEEFVLRIAERMLRKMGFETERAQHGEEAIARYCEARDRGRPFDLLIMDLTIPGRMGGVETLERLRQIDPAVRAIVSSGYSNDPVMAQYAEYGFAGVITKPYRYDDVKDIISEVLS